MKKQPPMHWTDLIRGHDGYLSGTKAMTAFFALVATVEIILQHLPGVRNHPSDTLVLGVLAIFVTKQALDNSKLSNRSSDNQEEK